MAQVDADEVLDVVTSRTELMHSLASDWKRKRDLTDALSVSRSTVDRGVRDLVDAGLAEREGDRYRLTVAGQLALSEYEQFTGRVDGALSARELLESMAGDVDVDPVVLDGATVVVRQSDDGGDPVAAVDDFLRRAAHVEAVLPAVSSGVVTALRDRLVEADASATVVLSDAALARLTSRHAAALEAMLETGRMTCLLADETPPYSLLLGDVAAGEEFCLAVHEDDRVAGVLLNDTLDAVEWARTRFERYADSARPLANQL